MFAGIAFEVVEFDGSSIEKFDQLVIARADRHRGATAEEVRFVERVVPDDRIRACRVGSFRVLQACGETHAVHRLIVVAACPGEFGQGRVEVHRHYFFIV